MNASPTMERANLLEILNLLISALPVPVIAIDAARRLVAANSAAQHIAGRYEAGRDVTFMFRAPELLEAIDAAIGSGETGVCELVVDRASARIFDAHVQALDLSGGNGVRVLVALIDKTASREAERMKSEFVANVSHELRSPLTTVMGAVETLQGLEANDKPARERFLSLMERESQRMRSIVDDLLSLANIESHRYVTPKGVVDLKAAIDTVLESLRPRAREKDMTIRFTPSGEPLTMEGDQAEIVQVLDNILDNAIKYGDASTEITINVNVPAQNPRTKQDCILISVHNHGKPIPPEHLPRLTQRFYRVDKSRSRELGGTGLGLAIVKHIVQRHGGSLNIESEAESGTKVSLYFPLNLPSEPAGLS